MVHNKISNIASVQTPHQPSGVVRRKTVVSAPLDGVHRQLKQRGPVGDFGGVVHVDLERRGQDRPPQYVGELNGVG